MRKKLAERVADVGVQAILWSATLAAVATFLYIGVYATATNDMGVVGVPGGLLMAAFAFGVVMMVGWAVLWVVLALLGEAQF